MINKKLLGAVIAVAAFGFGSASFADTTTTKHHHKAKHHHHKSTKNDVANKDEKNNTEKTATDTTNTNANPADTVAPAGDM